MYPMEIPKQEKLVLPPSLRDKEQQEKLLRQARGLRVALKNRGLAYAEFSRLRISDNKMNEGIAGHIGIDIAQLNDLVTTIDSILNARTIEYEIAMLFLEANRVSAGFKKAHDDDEADKAWGPGGHTVRVKQPKTPEDIY